ncbi:Uncharacterised protein [Vibrio cholerae]|uniref:Uncharacterized protein n=1 Tax=Vibrio cholerae TaxID=666 RepID=A0A655RGY2_VIBCL|nr:Uncharacterised protein [Vibrio cholerae]CSB94279.1 Uncharacterised protein [Vibrio cholerae]
MRSNKRLANTASFFITHWNVLQVRISGGETPSGRHCLMIGSMHAPCTWVNHLRQLIGIGRFEFGQTAVLNQNLGQWVIQSQLLQHFFIG